MVTTPANSINETTTGLTGFTGTSFTATPTTAHAVLVGGSTSSTITNVGPSATSGQILRSGGSSADPSYSTSTYPATNAINTLLYASSANTMAALSTANSSVLVTDGSGVPSLSTTIPNGVTATTQTASDNSTKLATTAYVDNSQNASVAFANGFRNKFRNPSFEIAQRGASGSITTSGGYALDGWFVISTGANGTWNQIDNTGNYAPYNMNLVGNTGVTGIKMYQRIDGHLCSQFFSHGEVDSTLTFQIFIVNSTGATLNPTLTVSYANALNNFSSTTTDINAVSLNSYPNNTSSITSYSWTPSSANYTNGIQVTIDFGNNFSANTNAVYLEGPDIRATTSLATGLNANQHDPEMRPFATELQFCQCFYETSYPNKTAPGTSGISFVQKNAVGANSAGFMTVPFKTQKFSTPSISYWDGAGNASKVSTYVAAGTATNNVAAAVAPTNISVNGFDWGSTAGATIVGVGLAWSASAEL